MSISDMDVTASSVQQLDPLSVISRFREHDFSLPDFLAARCELQPDAVALVFESRRWTYAQLARNAQHWAGWLAGHGVRSGDRVSVMSLNHPSTIFLLFGLAHLGAIMVPINPDFNAAEARYVLDRTEVCGVVVAPEKLAIIEEALHGLAITPWIMCNDALADDLDSPADDRPDSFTSAPPRPVQAADTPCLIICTSGTTGFPKGVMHSQRAYILAAEAYVERLWLQPDEHMLCVLPLFHINALMYSLGGALACGGTLVLAPRFSASQFWSLVHDTGVTQTNLVAAAGMILARRPRSEFIASHRLKKMFIGPQTPQLVDALRNQLGVSTLIECYGMTEIPGVISNPFTGPHIVGTLGLLCKHPDPRIERPRARVVDAQGSEVEPGVVGELQVKTPMLMLGYFRDPQQTAEAFCDGWFKTGDLVTLGPDGYYRFVARKKDIIRCRGENIASAEIERTLATHPQVADVAVIGVASDLGDEDIVAAIVCVSGETIEPEALAIWLRQRLVAIKVPRYLAFVTEIPYTPTQKQAKHRLKDDPALLLKAIDLQRRPPV